MNEIHSIEFNRFGVNILSNEEQGTIVLQFDASEYGLGAIGPTLKAVQGQFGHGIWGHFNRWMTGAGDILLVTSHAQPHPDHPEVIVVEMAVKEGARMDTALAALVDFFRSQPGYRRTMGPPLDPDAPHRPIRSGTGDASQTAWDTLRRIFEDRHRKEPQRSSFPGQRDRPFLGGGTK